MLALFSLSNPFHLPATQILAFCYDYHMIRLLRASNSHHDVVDSS